MCHRGSYMTRDGTFTVLGDRAVSGGGGLVGPMWCAAGAELRDERAPVAPIPQHVARKASGRVDRDTSFITSDLLRAARSPPGPGSCSQNVVLSRPTFRQVVADLAIQDQVTSG